MVHALDEIRRVLVPGGVLIDIRPVADRWHIGVGSAGKFKESGRLDDLPVQLNADTASNETMKEVESRGWFQREQEAYFTFLYSWDTPSEMEEFVAEEWYDFATLSEEAKLRTRAVWATSDADGRVQVRVKILITKWKALKG
jgi:hypothetical protein